MPYIEDIKKIDFSQENFYFLNNKNLNDILYNIFSDLNYELIDEQQQSNILKMIEQSDTVSYQTYYIPTSAGLFTIVGLKFYYHPLTISYKNTLNSINNNPTFYEINDGVVKLLPLEKEGYIFEGWYRDPEFQYRVEELNADTNDNLVLYAKWSKIDGILNPNTFTPFLVVCGIVFIVIFVTVITILCRKKVRNE